MRSDARDAMSGRFAGKSVLVAGGTGGLGRAVSLGFLDEGASVVVTYRDQKEFDVLESAVTEKSLFEGYNADLTDEAAVQQLIARILADHRGVDAVVKAVGAYARRVPLCALASKVLVTMMSL